MNPPDDELNFQPPRTDGGHGFDARNSGDGLDQIRDMLEQTKTNLIRTQRRIDRSERLWASFSRQLTALWVLVIMVIVGFGLLTLYQVLLQRRH